MSGIAVLNEVLPTVITSAGGQVPVIASLVNGRRVDIDGDAQERISPALGSPLFTWVDADQGVVDEAVTAARQAFSVGSWASATGAHRARVLHRAAEIMEARAENLAQIITLETGKPIREARGEVGATINSFAYFSGLARDVNGRTLRDVDAGLFSMTVREPAGVAAIIVPWNFPLAILGQKLPPALAAGCTAVVKPSPLTPLSTLAAVEILLEAGLDPGAVSVVLGGGAAGARLVSHPNVDAVSFTGSTETGRRIASAAGEHTLKRLALEAGGKTPVIVTQNADLDRAVRGILFASFFNQGQVCVAGSRILAHASVADELGALLAEASQRIALGDPFDAATEMGPLVSQEHRAGVLRSLDEASSTGAIVLAGGGVPESHDVGGRPFLQPTVLWSTDDGNVSAKDELFGPITVVQPFDNLAEVIARANDSQYGLGASVWSEDISEAMNLMLSLNTGTVWINSSTEAFPELPLGGRRDSGYSPEMGREGMEFFTSLKTVHMRLARAEAWYRA